MDLILKQEKVSKLACESGSLSAHKPLALVCQIMLECNSSSSLLQCPESLLNFLKCFTKDVNPAIMTAPLCIRSAVEALTFFPKGMSINVRKDLSVYSPMLLSIVDHLLVNKTPDNSCDKFRNFVADLLIYVDNTANNETNFFERNTTTEFSNSFYEGYAQGPLAELWATGHCFPSFPALCQIQTQSC